MLLIGLLIMVLRELLGRILVGVYLVFELIDVVLSALNLRIVVEDWVLSH